MAVFSEAEFKQFDAVMKQTHEDITKGKKPNISAVLMSLQFAATMPNEKNQYWFEDKMTALVMVMSVRKLMDDNLPDMFSVSEKAFMFSILNMGKVLAAIDAAGMDLDGFMSDENGNPVDEDGGEDFQ
jgi:hypothetical protein